MLVLVAIWVGKESTEALATGDRADFGEALPIAILGHAHGRIKGGQHLRYPQDSRFADLLLTTLQRTQIPVETIGDSGGLLTEV